MPRFPTKEADIADLADRMVSGYKNHPADFPGIVWVALNLRNLHYKSARKNRREKQAQAKLATQTKTDSFALLKRIMKEQLKQSEVDVAAEPEKLALIGWGPAKEPQPVERPGEPKILHSINQGKGNLTLKWDSPSSGGAVRNYIIERRCQKADGKFDSWKLIATAIQNHITLTNQPQKSTLEYRVKAVNISGESIPSNTIAIIL